MSSFYGGKRGASLEITKAYDTYQDMINDANNVDYNEYVIAKVVPADDTSSTTKSNVLYRRIQEGFQELTELTIQTVGDGGGGSGGGGEGSSVVASKSTTVIDSFSALKNNYSEQAGSGYTESNFMLSDCIAPSRELTDGVGNIVNVKYNYCTIQNTNAETGEVTYETHIGFQLPYQEIELEAGNSNITINKIKDESNPYKTTWQISSTGGGGSGSSGNAANVVYLQNLRVVEASQISNNTELRNPVDNSTIVVTDEWKKNRTTVMLYDQYADGVTTTFYFGDYNSIKSVEVDQENGTFTITDIKDNVQTYTFTDIEDISLVDGQLTISYKNKPADQATKAFTLKYVENITFDPATQKYTLHYSTKEEEPLELEVNLIEEVVVTEDKHLLIYYSSPTYRENHTTVTYKGKEGWVDYGIVSSDNGLYIGMNISPDDIMGPNDYTLSRSKAIQYLNDNYGEGLIGDNIAGKVVTIGYKDDPKDVYAFDYNINRKSWYFLGSIGQGGGSEEIADIGATNFFGDISLSLEDEVVQSLPNGCTWFVTEEI